MASEQMFNIVSSQAPLLNLKRTRPYTSQHSLLMLIATNMTSFLETQL